MLCGLCVYSVISVQRIEMTELLFQRLEGVAVFAVEHGPAGGGDFGAEGVGGFEVFGGFGGPAFLGEGGDFGGGFGFRRGRGQIETECEQNPVERGAVGFAAFSVYDGEECAECGGCIQIVMQCGDDVAEDVMRGGRIFG